MSHHVVPAEDLQDVVEQFQAVPPLVVRPVGHGGQRPAQLPQHHGQQHITALCEQTTTDDDAGGRKLFHQWEKIYIVRKFSLLWGKVLKETSVSVQTLLRFFFENSWNLWRPQHPHHYDGWCPRCPKEQIHPGPLCSQCSDINQASIYRFMYVCGSVCRTVITSIILGRRSSLSLTLINSNLWLIHVFIRSHVQCISSNCIHKETTEARESFD